MDKICIIINPAAGSEEPVREYIEECLKTMPYEIKEVHIENDIHTIVRDLSEEISLIAVYGGDGTVCEAAKALHGTSMPLFILPGGTANVMAKEICMPQDTRAALKILADGAYTIQAIDMGIVNDEPFLLRINLGIMADMITRTTTEMKDRWGQWAYGITAFKEIPSEGVTYDLTIDGRDHQQQAVALTVTNAGNIGKQGYSFLPGISISDGSLDLIALDSTNLISFIKLTGDILLHNDSAQLQHWKVREIKIVLPEQMQFLCDDAPQSAKELVIKVSPASLRIAMPRTV